jgi:membrane protease YdiL (CAAX protease family)
VDQTTERLSLARKIFVWFQLVIAYGLIECALWSPRLRIRNRWALAAAIVIVIFLLVDRPSIRRMGLGLPSTLGASIVFAISFAVAVVMIFFVESIGGQIAPMPTWTVLYRSGGYVIWALLQELLLQSFFFTRCEDLFGSSTAVWVAATLFAAAHLPNLILTTLTLAGGLFFCEMFRQYRSIYPVGIVHAVLGLTVAITMPDSLLHHMRAGIGFLQFRG